MGSALGLRLLGLMSWHNLWLSLVHSRRGDLLHAWVLVLKVLSELHQVIRRVGSSRPGQATTQHVEASF